MEEGSSKYKPGEKNKVITNNDCEKKPIRLGPSSKPKLAGQSRPTKGPQIQEGGKSVWVRTKERIGPVRPLDGWLLSGVSRPRGLALGLTERWSYRGA